MKTKNIFKSLAFVMLMPAMLLTTSCSNDNDIINDNNEPTAKESYKIPVTVNVTRQGDDAATRAEYDGTAKKLSFSEGDKLLVEGYLETDDVSFAGILTWISGGTFSGDLAISKKYTGTVEEMFTEASSGYPSNINATLLPNGYKGYNFLHIEGTGAGQKLEDPIYYCGYPVAGDLATAVEQFSLEQAFTYSSGFALAPQRAILNCSYKDISHANEDCWPYIAMYNNSEFAGGSVGLKFGADGIVNFAISVPPYNDKWTLCASDGENLLFEVNLGTKTLEAGYIYNWTNIVTWNSSNMPNSYNLNGGYTNGGVTLQGDGEIEGSTIWANAPLTLTAPSGKIFTSIVITASNVDVSGDGWSGGTWSGSSSSVEINVDIYGITSIVFTLEDE